MGAGRSGLSGGGGGKTSQMAYTGDENGWATYANQYQRSVSDADRDILYAEGGNHGYFASSNAGVIQRALIENPDKSFDEIFGDDAKSYPVVQEQLNVAKTLDRAIKNNKTPMDGEFSRFTTADEIKALYGLTDGQMQSITNTNASNVGDIGKILTGKTGVNNSFTETSANRNMSFWNDLMPIERRIFVKRGTNAYAHPAVPDESETVFGRYMNTNITGVSFENGKLVIHESFAGYNLGGGNRR